MPAQKRSYEAADANPDAEEASSKKPATMYTRRARRPLQNIEPRPTEENVTGFAEPTQQAGSISSPLSVGIYCVLSMLTMRKKRRWQST